MRRLCDASTRRRGIPDGNGKLQRPESVLFESLGWTPDPFLLSKS